MRYLLDSDIIIDYLRDYRPTISRLERLLKKGDNLFVSVITNLELHVGESIIREETHKKINELFKLLAMVEIDALIAASAYDIDAVLITRNLKHYRPIKEIKLKPI